MVSIYPKYPICLGGTVNWIVIPDAIHFLGATSGKDTMFPN